MDYYTKKIEELKEYLNSPMEKQIYFKKDGTLHKLLGLSAVTQITHNTYNILKDIVSILEYLDNKQRYP